MVPYGVRVSPPRPDETRNHRGVQRAPNDGWPGIDRHLALVMSIVALAVDIKLPTFADIRTEFGLAADSTAAAGLITTVLLGLAVSQLVYGC